jgi:hypothetical protein
MLRQRQITLRPVRAADLDELYEPSHRHRRTVARTFRAACMSESSVPEALPGRMASGIARRGHARDPRWDRPHRRPRRVLPGRRRTGTRSSSRTSSTTMSDGRRGYVDRGRPARRRLPVRHQAEATGSTWRRQPRDRHPRARQDVPAVHRRRVRGQRERKTLDVLNPARDEVIATVPASDQEDVDRAAKARRRPSRPGARRRRRIAASSS